MTSDPRQSALARSESGVSSRDSGIHFPLPSGLNFTSHRTGIFPGHPTFLMDRTFVRGMEVWPTLKAWIVHFHATPTQKWLDSLGSLGPKDWARLEDLGGRLIEDPNRPILFSVVFTWQGTVTAAAARLMADPDFVAQLREKGLALPG